MSDVFSLSGVEFLEVSRVPASKCRECQSRMDPCSRSHWACPNESCTNRGKPVCTGVYPVWDDPFKEEANE